MPEVQTRTVLWYLVFFGFAVNYMIRINLNITIVEMVKQPQTKIAVVKSEKNKTEYEILHKNHMLQYQNERADNFEHNFTKSFNETPNNSTILQSKVMVINKKKIIRMQTLETIILDGLAIKYEKNGFTWNENEQGLVLGSFYWIHWLTQIPGAILAKKYGTKLVFGLSNVIGCWVCFILPMVSYFGVQPLLVVRSIQGFICGVSWPAMHHMTALWIPPNERSTFVSAYLGGSVGIAIFYPLFGYIISVSAWEWVFHICGIIGTIWYFCWLYFVYDTPSSHPRISKTELLYIEKSLGSTVTSKQNKSKMTPWKNILTSKPVWLNVIAQWGGIWGLFTIMTQAPTYFKNIHHWDIKMTGILSGLPHLARIIFAYFFSSFGDFLLRADKMSRTNVRKLATSVCCILKGLFVLALAYSGSSSTGSLLFLTLATMVHGAVSTGPLASIVDISPNYACIVLGISGMVGVLPGFISPIVVGMLTFQNQTVESWKYVFLITSGMLIISGILYVILCESTLQSWNDLDLTADSKYEAELEKLHNNRGASQKENPKPVISLQENIT